MNLAGNLIERNDILTLNINGTETQVLVEAIFNVDGTDYISLIPYSQIESETPQSSIYVYKEINDSVEFSMPTDEQFEIARKALIAIFSDDEEV